MFCKVFQLITQFTTDPNKGIVIINIRTTLTKTLGQDYTF